VCSRKKCGCGFARGRSRESRDRGARRCWPLYRDPRAVRGRRPGADSQQHGDAGNQKSARQLLDDRVKQGLKIGFRTEATAKFDQRLAVIVAMAVKGAVDPALRAALEGIENRGRNQDGDDQTPGAHGLRHGVVHQNGDQRDDAEVAAQKQSCGQRVSHAALEDQVGIHQPVADNGPTEGQRQNNLREAGEIRQQLRRIEMQ
jgi:hypothetical protein